MGIFAVLIFFPILMQHVKIKNDHTLHRGPTEYEKKNKSALAFFFIFLTVLLMFRHESVGNDTANYISHFLAYSNTGWENVRRENVEAGFSYFNKLVSVISKEPQFFLGVISVLTCTMIYSTYRRCSVDTALTIVLYCSMPTFIMMFSGIRQMLAISIGFLAYECTRRKKLLFFILCVFLATVFHTSAIMLIAMYPLYHARITKKWLIVIVPVILLIFWMNQQIFSVLVMILERFTRYNGEITQTGAYTMLILFAMFAVFSFIIPDESRIDAETLGLRNYLLFSLILQMFAPLHTIAMRMNYYYIIFIPLLLPRIIAYRNKRWEQVAVMCRHIMVVFFAIYFFISANSGNNLGVFPYHFFWESV